MKQLVDAEARGRVRRASLVPLTVAVAALTEFGRTDATTALCALAAPSAPLPAHRPSACRCVPLSTPLSVPLSP